MSSYPTPPASSETKSAPSYVGMGDSEANQQVVKDPDYFIEVVVFQVENVLFSVPRHHFADSEGIFGTLFTLPQEQNSSQKAEGTCAEHPIMLSQDKAEDFRALMKVLYPKCVSHNGLEIQADIPQNDPRHIRADHPGRVVLHSTPLDKVRL
jgi:hypothetical protein